MTVKQGYLRPVGPVKPSHLSCAYKLNPYQGKEVSLSHRNATVEDILLVSVKLLSTAVVMPSNLFPNVQIQFTRHKRPLL